MITNKLYDLDGLLKRNNIERKKLDIEVYRALIISIFELIVKKMENESIKKEIRRRLLNSQNKILTIQNIVYELTGCKLSEFEDQIILNYMIAHFNKSNSRKVFDDLFKQELLNKQQNKCSICNSKITLCNSELDHIIPWIYVGDELGKINYQMLCKSCNRNKNKNVAYNLKLFIVNKS